MIKMTEKNFLEELLNAEERAEEIKTDGCRSVDGEHYGKGYLSGKVLEIKIELKK